MSGCIILSDRAVGEILLSLSKDEIQKSLDEIAQTLRDYSVGSEREYQPGPNVVKRPDGRKTLFRPFTSPTSVGLKLVVDPAERGAPLHGILALCDQDGLPTGLLNAEEITGYRTTLNAMVLYGYRKETANIVVFGAGKQALWHMRLALSLRGADVKRITVINRSVDRAKSLVEQIQKENEERWKSPVVVQCLDVKSSDHDKVLQSVLTDADVVFCTTPSKEPLFPAQYLTGTNRKGRYISTIGSWTPDMIELDPGLMKEAAELSSEYHPKGNAEWGVIVDDRDECFKSSGEIIQSKLEAKQVAELGEVLDLAASSTGQEQDNLYRWLQEGFVVYKSVGVSVTDLTAGNFVLSMARARGIGLQLAEF